MSNLFYQAMIQQIEDLNYLFHRKHQPTNYLTSLLIPGKSHHGAYIADGILKEYNQDELNEIYNLMYDAEEDIISYLRYGNDVSVHRGYTLFSLPVPPLSEFAEYKDFGEYMYDIISLDDRKESIHRFLQHWKHRNH